MNRRSLRQLVLGLLLLLLGAPALAEAPPAVPDKDTPAASVPGGHVAPATRSRTKKRRHRRRRTGKLRARHGAGRGQRSRKASAAATAPPPAPVNPPVVPPPAPVVEVAPPTPPSTPAPPPPEPAPTPPSTDFAPAYVPLSDLDLTWLPGNYGPTESLLHWGPFTGEVRVDVPWHFSLNRPADDTISGSSEVFRHNEFQITQVGFGGDFYYRGAHGRLMTLFGLYSQATPRTDPSAGRGQWELADAYRYLSEAYVGYHVNVLRGLNVQAGIFLSYVGLWSYYNADNWTYQPSFVSSNVPWFFNGARVQLFPSDRVKLELWLVNGWQSYGTFNTAPGVGLQVRYTPTEWLNLVANQYTGTDTLGLPGRRRFHSDDSVMVRLHRDPAARGVSMAAASLTLGAGCEWGDAEGAVPAVGCGSQYFLGFMAYVRLWLFRDTFGATVGGGMMTNPGRYLVLVPPINGATAITGTPYFTTNPGDAFTGWDVQVTWDYFPTRNLTFRCEFTHRASDVPYWTGPGGITPPGGNNGRPADRIPGWTPDLATSEDRFTLAMMLRM